MAQSTVLTNGHVENKNVHHLAGDFDFLRNDELGMLIVSRINEKFKIQPSMAVNLRTHDYSHPIRKGHLFYVSAVNTVLDEEGIVDVGVVSPKRLTDALNSTNLSNLVTETGIAIMRKPRISYTDYPLINRLVEQAQIQDYMFPVVLHGLRLRPEPNNPDFYHGLSLEYTDRSELMLAPSLKNGRHMSSTKLSLQEILKGTKADENNLAVFSYALILPHVSAYTFGFRLSNIDREIGQLSIYQLNEYPHGRVVLMKRL